MRLLIVSKINPYCDKQQGGAESSLKLIAEKFAQKGHLVYLAANNVKETHRLIARKSNVRLLNWPRVPGSRIRLIRRLNIFLFRIWISQVISRSRIDLAYCFYQIEVLQSLISIRSVNHRFRVVMRMAGLYWHEQSKTNPALSNEYSDYFSRVDSINYISEGVKSLSHRAFKELGINPNIKNFFIADIGSSKAVGRDSQYMLQNNGKFNLCIVARFSHYQKRQDILIDALVELSDPRLRLHFIGEGPLRNRMQEKVKALDLEDKVFFLPFMDQGKLWPVLENMQLMCHCTEYEGLGKSIIEAMALGLPVLASDVSPLNLFIKDGENGLLVKNDPSRWCEKIKCITKKPHQLMTISSNSMEFITENFNPDKNVLIYERHFRQLIYKERM